MYASPHNSPKHEIDEKIYVEPKLETIEEIEEKTAKKDDDFIKSVIDENKADIQISKDAEIKKIQDVFDEVKDKNKIVKPDVFFIDDMDIFDQENVSETDRRPIMDLIDKTTFIADAKKYLEERVQEWKFLMINKKIKKRRNTC